jgi:hypothetical protein
MTRSAQYSKSPVEGGRKLQANTIGEASARAVSNSGITRRSDLSGLAFVQASQKNYGLAERANTFSAVRAKWRIGRRMQTDAKLWKTCWPLKTRSPQSWRRATRKLWAISRYCLKRLVKSPLPSTARNDAEKFHLHDPSFRFIDYLSLLVSLAECLFNKASSFAAPGGGATPVVTISRFSSFLP